MTDKYTAGYRQFREHVDLTLIAHEACAADRLNNTFRHNSYLRGKVRLLVHLRLKE